MRCDPGAGRRRSRRRIARIGASYGGAHARRRRHDHRRRLQRQPGFDAGGYQSPGDDGTSRNAPVAGPSRCSARWQNSATTPSSSTTRSAGSRSGSTSAASSRSDRTRQVRGLYQGAVMEGSWGEEACHVPDADAAIAVLREELEPGDIVLVKASQSVGLWAVADAAARRPRRPTPLLRGRRTPGETDSLCRRYRTCGVDPAHPGPDQGLLPAGLRPGDPGRGPAEPSGQARHAHDGRRRDPRRTVGRLLGLAPDRPRLRRSGTHGVGPAGPRSDHRTRRCRFPRRLHQDPQAAQPGSEQDGQARRPAGRGRGLRHPGAAVPQQRRTDARQHRPVVRARHRHGVDGFDRVHPLRATCWSARGRTR